MQNLRGARSFSISVCLMLLLAGIGACGDDAGGGSDAGGTAGVTGGSGGNAGNAGRGGAGGGGNGGNGGASGAGSGDDAGTDDAGSVDAGGGTDAGADAGGCINLEVKNTLSWCSVSVNGGTPSSGATQTVCVVPGTVTVTAVALTGFILGTAPWHETDGDTGAGDGEQGTLTGSGQSTQSATTVTVGSTATCAWVCCPFTNGTGCPTTNQCP